MKPPSGPVKVDMPMTIVGFNAQTAKAHGYEIRTNANGQQYSVKVGTTPAATASPDSEPVVYGNCGDSFIYYDYAGWRPQSPHIEAWFETGYNVMDDAYGGTWVANFVDNAGVGRVVVPYAANGTPSWSHSGYTFHSVAGYSYAQVQAGNVIYLDDGAECVSGAPWDSTEL